MKSFWRFFLIFVLIFSSSAPFLYGKPARVEAAGTVLKLGFTPNDTAMDPNKPVIYMTDGSQTVYAVNYVTNEVKSLKLRYPASRLELYNGTLYVTQQVMKHDINSNGPYSGAIAGINTNSFTLTTMLNVNIDPFDIAIDENGNLYISSASGQQQYIKVYSLNDEVEIPNKINNETLITPNSYLYYNPAVSKLYAVTTYNSLNMLIGLEVKNGVIQNQYTNIDLKGYPLTHSFVKTAPDGSSLYNYNGTVMESTKYQPGDMEQRFQLAGSYNDYAFDVQNGWTFAAGSDGGIDVYQYDTNRLLTSTCNDLNVQWIYVQNGSLVTINKDKSGSYFIETLNENQMKIPGIPFPVNNLWFKPNDTAIDPVKSIIYMTRLGSNTIYAVNFSSGEIKSLNLPYPAERLALYNNKLYVTQQKMPHTASSSEPLAGAIAEVNTSDFTLNRVIDINTDPFDIAINNGFIYVSPGSNQFNQIRAYSLDTGAEVPNTSGFASMCMGAYVYANPTSSKIYSLDSELHPIRISAYEVQDGVVQKQYNEPSTDTFSLQPFSKITPDGLSMYNTSGVVFNLAQTQKGDMNYAFSLRKSYSDYEFSLEDQLTFAAGTDGGIDVYKYGTNNYLYTLAKGQHVLNLQYQNGKLVVICSKSNGEYFIETMDANTPSTPVGTGTPIEVEKSVLGSWTSNGDYNTASFTDGVKDLPLPSIFSFQLNQDVTLANASGITITGPIGVVNSSIKVFDNTLTIAPEHLNGNTAYTLTIQKDALAGSQGQGAADDVVIHFQTKTSWMQNNGKRYYMDPATGGLATGWKQIDGSTYYFNENGEMQTGWLQQGNTRYYLQQDGVMQTGWKQLGSSKYYFQSSGVMQTGWLQQGNTRYYFQANGAMQTGWKQLGSSKYYFQSNGVMQTGWLQQGKTRYYFQPNGTMKTGWLQQGKTWYYFQPSGAMQTGWALIGGKWYYFYSSGSMASNTEIGSYKLGANGARVH